MSDRVTDERDGPEAGYPCINATLPILGGRCLLTVYLR